MNFTEFQDYFRTIIIALKVLSKFSNLNIFMKIRFQLCFELLRCLFCFFNQLGCALDTPLL